MGHAAVVGFMPWCYRDVKKKYALVSAMVTFLLCTASISSSSVPGFLSRQQQSPAAELRLISLFDFSVIALTTE